MEYILANVELQMYKVVVKCKIVLFLKSSNNPSFDKDFLYSYPVSGHYPSSCSNKTGRLIMSTKKLY
jgi:hypothetical protein